MLIVAPATVIKLILVVAPVVLADRLYILLRYTLFKVPPDTKIPCMVALPVLAPVEIFEISLSRQKLAVNVPPKNIPNILGLLVAGATALALKLLNMFLYTLNETGVILAQ